jgi:hypothetical protein
MEIEDGMTSAEAELRTGSPLDDITTPSQLDAREMPSRVSRPGKESVDTPTHIGKSVTQVDS